MGTIKTIALSRRMLGSVVLFFLVCAYFSGATLAAEQEVDFEFDDDATDVRIVKRAADITDDEDFLSDEPGSGYEGSGTEEATVISTVRPTADPNYPQFYRVSFKIDSLPWMQELGNRNSPQFLALAEIIKRDLEDLYGSHPGEQLITILSFSKGSVIVTFDLGAQGGLTEEQLKEVLKKAFETGKLGNNRVSMDGFEFKPLEAVKNVRCSLRQFACAKSAKCIARALACNGVNDCMHGEDEIGCPHVQCPEFVGRSPDSLPGVGNNRANLLVNNAFPCDGTITGWEYYRTSIDGTAFVSVWRQISDSQFIMVKKTELPAAPLGVNEVLLQDPIAVVQGDFIGIFFPRSASRNVISFAKLQDGVVSTGQLYQNYQTELYDSDIRENEPIDLNKVPFETLNATFAIRAIMDYDTSGVGPDPGSFFTCKSDEFACGDGNCIKAAYVCDNQLDCPLGTDEEGCATPTDEPEPCLEGRFRCDDGTCVNRRFKCDGQPDCPDASDETGCTQCKADQFTCDSGQCISTFVLCNGLPDCQDGSDEVNCPPEACKQDEFTCTDGSCIRAEQECDSRVDCRDGSDETNCGGQACGADEFTCKDGSCIPINRKCDAFPDCDDNSDEEEDMCLDEIPTIPPACPDGFFRCTNGICLTMDERCDGNRDCFDGSDEENCPKKKCQDDEFQCGDGDCIPEQQHCDNFPDCADLSDEVDCGLTIYGPNEVRLGTRIRISCNATASPEVPPYIHWFRGKTNLSAEASEQGRYYRIYDYPRKEYGYFFTELDIFRVQASDSGTYTCRISPQRFDSLVVTITNKACRSDEFTCRSSGLCIDKRKACDGYVDCSDRSDEYDCQCSNEEFRCDDGLCIALERKCDGVVDCQQASDERNCTCSEGQFQCTTGQCIDARRYCDRRFDCFDESDEKNCRTNLACVLGQRQCESGRQCYEEYQHCDGYEDCNDGSDEASCSVHCNENQFVCDANVCMENSKRCDGKADCQDYSDETNCDPSVDFMITPFEINILEGSTAVFQCSGFYGDTSDLEWIRETGGDMPANAVIDAGKLSIPNCRRGDSGVYMCRMIRPIADGKSSARARLTVIPDDDPCSGDAFRCGDDSCIPRSQVCDRFVQCADASDETSGCTCDDTEMACANGQCIPASASCDGRDDCFDGSDETFCEPTKRACTSNEFTCNNGDCIDSRRQCDKTRDCQDGSDEVGCPGCFTDEFECGSGTCIHLSYRCDKTEHCPDGSDEVGCPKVECTVDEFTCMDGQCISSDKKCDGSADCDDGSDESKCPVTPAPCSSNEFSCDNGDCIDARHQCDSIEDCTDGSDEHGCRVDRHCYEYEFRCNNGQCVSADQRCDRRSDCADGSDERQCDPKIHLMITPDQLVVRQGQDAVFECSGFNGDTSLVEWVRRTGGDMPSSAVVENGRLTIRNARSEDAGDYLCKVTVDIMDAKTEASARLTVDVEPITRLCPDHLFQCDSGHCLDMTRKCDGREDCPNASDERDCPTCSPEEFTCATNGQCIPKSQRCDDKSDCDDRSDERGCPCKSDEFTCLSDGRCLPPGYKCNGNPDCTDGSDEVSCGADRICYEYEFRCNNGQCVNADQRCDRRYDCADGSDERQCDPNIHLMITPDQLVVRQGQDAVFECSGFNGDTSLVEWVRRTGGDMPSSAVVENGRLTIRNARSEDAGDYSCKVTVDIMDVKTEASARLTVDVAPPQISLSVTPQNLRVRAGMNVLFVCSVNGGATSKIEWVRRVGGAMPPTAAQDRTGRLTITRAEPRDAGDYTCRYKVGDKYVETYVRLGVDYIGPQTEQTKTNGSCDAGGSTCSDGSCIPRDYVCDGEDDCADGSDENDCNTALPCEPNEFRCNNGRCVLKIWKCDGDDDCFDKSDEIDCPTSEPGAPCRADEFSCRSGDQCVPLSYQCDSQNDCQDRSDEIACSAPSIVTPPQAEITVEVNGTFTIICEAVGVPTPLIVWRLNWGNIPTGPRVTVTSEEGRGTLQITNALTSDAGAYTCEAINNRGSIFAIPDALIIVRATKKCQSPYFNSEATNSNQCVRCFCFGRTQTCYSSTLQMSQISLGNSVELVRRTTLEPTERGFVQYIPASKEFEVKDFNRVLRTGSYYWSLPYQYLSKRLSSYGGTLSYDVLYEVDGFDVPTDDPDVILIGNGITLFHRRERPFKPSMATTVAVPLLETSWERSRDNRLDSTSISDYASREDLMTLLDNVTTILIRATYDNKQSYIKLGDVLLTSGVVQTTGLGRAVLVEECSCPTGYTGLSCEECDRGFYNVRRGRFGRECSACNCNGHSNDCDWATGQCRACRDNTAGANCNECAPGYFGDPTSGRPDACQPCPCPLTNPENQFSPTCRLDSDGQVTCLSCPVGYVGRRCERCDDGYKGDPSTIGDYCKPFKQGILCDLRGSSSSTPPPGSSQCACKANVRGSSCNECNKNTFYLSDNNPDGCISCFCMGVTQTCQSTTSNRSQVILAFNTSPGGVYLTDPKHKERIENNLRVDSQNRELIFRGFSDSSSRPTHWMLPEQFLGDKVSSYGGNLRFTLRFTAGQDNTPVDTREPLVEIGGNSITIMYRPRGQLQPNRQQSFSIPFIETEWVRMSGEKVTREHLMMALADLDYIIVKAAYVRDMEETAISSISLDIAENRNTGLERAYSVEQCFCPRGYKGLSCEDCATGYTRTGGGLYVGLCHACQCNGHSSTCDPETGVCRNCRHNTYGDNCEKCARGFYGDATRGTVNDCQRCPCPLTEAPNQFSTDCFLDTDDQVTCSACPVGHEGRQCERCADGYLGNPMRPNDYCKLINVTCDCDVRGIIPNTLCDSSTQQCQCKTYAQGKRCSSCQDGYFHLSRDNQQGCLKCFCSGVSTQCSSSNYYREEITPMLNSDGTHNFVLTTRRLRSPISDGFTMNADENEITFDRFDGIQRARESLYIQLPPKFRGDKVTSYGGFLRFGISFTDSGTGRDYQDVDVEIISNQDKRIYHLFRPSPRSRNSYNYDIKLVESSFRNLMDGDYPSREDFMYVLSDIQAILIRATYNTEMGSFSLRDVSMDSAVPAKTSLRSAQEVESCTCPEGYAGLSCQNCAAGYLKVDSNEGPRCMRCNCNGHADSCDPDTGECLNCKDNTEGNRCQNCARGYYGDPTAGTPDDCRVCTCPLNIPSNQFSPTCLLDRDNKVTCDRCPRGYTGRNCESCADGYRGNPKQPGGRCEPDDGPRPSVIVSPSSVTEPLGSTATFQCSPQGRGPFNVVWSRLDGKPLPERSTSGPGPNYILTITNLEYADSARYVCTTTSVRGTTSQGYVVLRVSPIETPLRIRIEEPTTLILERGQPARFFCVAVEYSSDANYILSWSKDGGHLPAKANDISGVLLIPNVDESDLGTYRCTGSDPISKDTATAVIEFGDFPKPPTVRIEPRYLQVDVGESVEFRCIAEGTPRPTVQWTKGASDPLPSYVETDDNGLLRIDSVIEDDQSEYYCKAVNSEGTSSVRTIIYVNRPTRPIEIIVRRATIEAVIGSTEQLTCYSNPSGAATLVWTRNGGLPLGVTQTNGVLTLANIQPSYAGDYICTGSTVSGIAGRSNVRVTVTGERVERPTARIEPDRQIVSSGTTGTLRCIVTGTPLPTITWSKARGGLSPNHQVNGNVLRILQASMEDRDIYVCRAENRGGFAQASAMVDIERRELPQIEIYPDVQQTKVAGSSAMLQCRVTRGIPSPTLSWSRAGSKDMTSRTKVTIENGVIMFTRLTSEEQGEYICTATNEVGTISATASLRVDGPPTIEITPGKRITSLVGERVNVECVGIGSPTPNVLWESTKRRRSDVLPEAFQVSPGVARLTFDSIERNDAGRYICIAANEKGEARETVDIIVTDRTSPVGPKVKIEGPENISAILGQSVTLTCSAPGIPNARIRWRRPRGLALPPNHSVRNGVLFLPSLEEEYTGEYICSVSSDIERQVYTSSVYIIVRLIPKIVVSPQRLAIRVNEAITLRCQPNGRGPFTIEWTRLNGVMSPQARERDGTLMIKRATRADSGRYRCIVRNDAGTSEAFADVVVFAPPSVTVNPPQSVVTVGETVILECLIQGNVQADIRWEKVSGDLPPQHEIRNGLLTLYNVQVADTGRYMCTASNEGGLSRQIGYIQVDSGTSVNPGIPVKTFNVGDQVEFECVVKGAGQTSMTWVRKEGPLPASAAIGGHFLYIRNAQVEDSGTYTCTASNEAGSVESHVKLLVQDDKTIRPVPPSQEYTTASLGSPAQLRCEASGSPQPRISWIKEEGDLPDDHSIIDGGDLYIPRVREEDAGKYNCLASSTYGTHRYPVVLIVGSLVPYFQQNPASYMTFSPLTDAYLETDITMSFRPEATDGLILYNGQYGTGSGDYLCFGLREAYPEFRFDVGAGPAVIRGAKPLELNKWHTVQLRRNRKNGNLTINDEPVYRGEAPGVFQGLDLAQPLYLGSVPDFSTLPRTASFNTGFVGGISQVELQGLNLNLGKDAREVVGVEAYPVCRDSNCENGGLCQPANNAKGFVCNCDRGYAGERCEILGQKCFPGACGDQGRCVDLPNGQSFACICPIGLNGEGCNPGLTIVDPAFNKTSFISYPTIKDGVLSVRIQLIFKPRSLDDSVILYNARRTDGNEDFIALVIKDRHLEFRFDTGSGPAVLRSRYPLTNDAWTMVKADRKGRDGMLTIDQEEAVNGSTSGFATMGLNLDRPLFLGGIDPEEKLSPNAGASEGFVGCIGELTINDEKMDLIQDAIESVNVQDCGDRSLCARKPCKNNGNCVDVSPTEYRCECPQQFSGDDCEIEMNICVTSQPCLNEGNCLVTDTGAFECQCPLGFMGRNCETAVELGTNVEFLKDGYVEYPMSFLPHRRRQVTEEILMTISTLEEGSALLFWQGQRAGEQAKKDYLAISIVDGFVEFRYELGSGPAVIKSTTRVNDGFDHIIKAQRLGRKGTLTVDNQPAVKGTSQGPLQVLNVQGNIFFGGVPDLSLYTDSLYTKNYEGCVSGIQLSGKPVIDFKSDPIGGMNVQPCLNSKK